MLNLLKLELRRKQLGMSRNSLARLAKISLPTVTRILTGKESSPSIATVEAIAAALGLAVQFTELEDPESMREKQAIRRATQIVGMVQGTMGLEDQGMDQQTVRRLTKRNAQKLLGGSNRRLWNE